MTSAIVEGDLPKWVTATYIEESLRKRYNDPTIQLTRLQGGSSNGKGENYTSCIVRLKASHVSASRPQPITQAYLIKMTFQQDDVQTRVLSPYKITECEIEIYSSVAPRINRLMQEIGDTDLLFAPTLSVDAAHSAIVFEDLVASHFGMADRVGRLDIQHAHLALRKLAKIHACGAVLNERDPTLLANKYQRGFFNQHTQGLKPMHCGILSAMGRYVKSQPHLSAKYGQKIDGLVGRLMADTTKYFSPDPKHFLTLTHGDYWTNNMMFQYLEGQDDPSDQCPLDWQLCVWGHPAIDLHYFFNTSLQEDLRSHRQTELIAYYYDILADTLRKLKFNGHIPTLYQFNLEVQARKYLAIYASFVFQPIFFNTNTEHADFSNLVGEDECGIRFKDSLFQNEQIQKTVELLLPLYNDLGLLDPLE